MNRMLFACYGANFNDYGLIHDIVDATADFGAGTELTVFTKNSRFPDHIWGLMKEIVPFKNTYVTLHGPYYEVEAASMRGSTENDYFFESYRQSFGIYHAFSAHSLTVHTHQFAFDPSEREQRLRLSRESMIRLSEMAEDADINLLIENVGEPSHGNVLYDQTAYIELFDCLPDSAGALIDIGHAICNGWDIFSVIDALGTRIRGYHIHNNDGTRDQHLPVFYPGLRYDREEMTRLLRYMEKKTPKSEWILEYAPGSHITPEAIRTDMLDVMTAIS